RQFRLTCHKCPDGERGREGGNKKSRRLTVSEAPKPLFCNVPLAPYAEAQRRWGGKGDIFMNSPEIQPQMPRSKLVLFVVLFAAGAILAVVSFRYFHFDAGQKQ